MENPMTMSILGSIWSSFTIFGTILWVDLFLGGLLFATIAKVINGKNTIVATNRNKHVTPYHHAKHGWWFQIDMRSWGWRSPMTRIFFRCSTTNQFHGNNLLSAIGNHVAMISGHNHKWYPLVKWPFSIAVLNFQRVMQSMSTNW